jgi:hypothetical protein
MYDKIVDSSTTTPPDENLIFQITYKETMRCKSSRNFWCGYLAKYPTRSELMKDWLQEQALAAAAATKKNSELQDEVQDLKERPANEVAEREYDKEESRRLMEQQLEATRNEMRKEFLAMLAQQKETTPQQVILFENVKHNFIFTPYIIDNVSLFFKFSSADSHTTNAKHHWYYWHLSWIGNKLFIPIST